MQEILPPKVGSLFLSSFKKLNSGSTLSTIEYSLDIAGKKHEFEARLTSLPESNQLIAIVRDITEKKMAENALSESHRQTNQQNIILSAINRLFTESIECESSKDVARICLSVAEDVTKSQYGSIAEINKEGYFDTLALSDPGWDACKMAELNPNLIQNMKIKGMWKSALNSKRGIIINNPSSHSQCVGLPEGHPPITAFMGIPFQHKKFKGMIGVANRKDGYRESDKELIEAIAFAFAEVINNKRAEEELFENHRKLSTLMSNLPGMAYRCLNDSNWTMRYLSKGCLSLTGYNTDEIIDNQDIAFSQLIHPDDKENVWNTIQNKLKNNKSFELEYRLISKSGEEKWVIELGKGVYGKDKKLLALEGVILDNNINKLAELELIHSESCFRALFNRAGVGIAEIDSISGKFIRVNEFFCEMIGYSANEFNSLDFQTITHPKDLQEDLNNMELLMSGKIPSFAMEKRYYHKNGSLVWGELSVTPLWPSGMPPSRHIAVVENITEKKQVEQALRNNEEKFRALFEQAGGYCMILDPNTTDGIPVIVDANKAACSAHGYTREEFIGRPIADIDDESGKQLLYVCLEAYLMAREE